MRLCIISLILVCTAYSSLHVYRGCHNGMPPCALAAEWQLARIPTFVLPNLTAISHCAEVCRGCADLHCHHFASRVPSCMYYMHQALTLPLHSYYYGFNTKMDSNAMCCDIHVTLYNMHSVDLQPKCMTCNVTLKTCIAFRAYFYL